MDSIVKFFALGGLSMNGTNLYCVDIDGDLFVLSCGNGKPDKTTPGIDFIVPDFSFLEKNKNRIKAYIFNDGHDDTIGALPYLYSKAPAPIYCTFYTSLSFKMLLDKRKLKFDYDIKEINATSKIKIAGHNVSFYRVSHSSPDTFNFAIETSLGNVIFASDYIIEHSANDHFKFDFNSLMEIAKSKTLALLVDSNNAARKGYTSPAHRIKDIIRKPISDAEGKVFVAFYANHIYNFIEVIEECINSNRQICLYDKETEAVFRSLVLSKVINVPPRLIVDRENITRIPDKNIAIMMTGGGEDIYQKISLLALRDVDDLRFAIKEKDTFIITCPPSYSFEVLAVDTLDELYRTNCNVVSISRKQLVKMHPSEDDIKLIISLTHPMYYIPIKGEYKDLVANATMVSAANLGLNHANILLIDNGMEVVFDPKKGSPTINDLQEQNVSIGTLMIDGSGVGDVANEIINERTRLGEDGIIVMSCVVSKTLKKIVATPDVQMRGYLFVKDSEQILKAVTKIFIDNINNWLNETSDFDIVELRKKIIDESTRFSRRQTRKSPVIDPCIVIVD